MERVRSCVVYWRGESNTKRDPAQLLKKIGACLPEALDCAVLRRQVGTVRRRGVICRRRERRGYGAHVRLTARDPTDVLLLELLRACLRVHKRLCCLSSPY